MEAEIGNVAPFGKTPDVNHNNRGTTSGTPTGITLLAPPTGVSIVRVNDVTQEHTRTEAILPNGKLIATVSSESIVNHDAVAHHQMATLLPIRDDRARDLLKEGAIPQEGKVETAESTTLKPIRTCLTGAASLLLRLARS